MKYILLSFWASFLLFISVTVFAQQGSPEGFFTSEANLAPTEKGVLVSIKKYNATQKEIENATKPVKNTPLNYLMAPFEAVDISMYDKGFESKLYFLNKEGKSLWDMTLGFSGKSVASPIKIFKDFIYTGECAKEADKVIIRKIDLTGKVIWQTALDSLQSLNDIYVDENRVSALVSFDASQRIEYSDSTFSERRYPIYFFVQLDINTGARIVKSYQSMANYLSSMNYSNPVINTDFSYFLNNKDSAIFLSVTKLDGATVVSKMNKESSILKLAGGTESYHILTLNTVEGRPKDYKLISDFYGKKKKYESVIPVEFNKVNRYFVYKTDGDSIVTIIGNSKNVSIVYSDVDGKTTVGNKIENVVSPIVGSYVYSGKVYILLVDGRVKPGSTGRLKIEYY